MSLVLEITCTNLKLGYSGTTKPDLLSINYEHTTLKPQLPPQYELNDHALAEEDRKELVKQLDPELRMLLDECGNIQGTWLHLREEKLTKKLLQKLIYNVLFRNSYSAKRIFIVDHDFSEKLKRIIYEIFRELRAKSIIYLPFSVLAVLGSGLRSGLVLNFTFEVLKIQSVIDLRVVDRMEEIKVNCLNKSEERYSLIEDLINKIIQRSPIDIRRCLRENIIVVGDESNASHDIDLSEDRKRFETRYSKGCWIACSLYSQVTTKWEDYKPY
ncbi:hypothetical protein KGF56_002430 [Candida oxycetoniae]|uniref:Uncharacterized protein n=1 Tax=Candida oxycetoniae TaxID=497107 RepID=A0AAI9WY99_9ASCO|nr:uncharacterized protein KGF56_002430 [Candida oxycetoniae]KAI3404800.2 hypothetical protein KGF56_002430 [Candida oxycetoniae]